jgi:hypothetical protein
MAPARRQEAGAAAPRGLPADAQPRDPDRAADANLLRRAQSEEARDRRRSSPAYGRRARGRVGSSARQALGARWHAGPAPVTRAQSRLRDEPLRMAGSFRSAEQRLPVAHRRGAAHGARALDHFTARLDAAQAVPLVEAVPDDVDERHRRHVVPEHHRSST